MKQYSLRQLQMAFLKVELKDEVQDEKTCVYCWRKGCGCGVEHTVKEDLFLNFTGEELNYA